MTQKSHSWRLFSNGHAKIDCLRVLWKKRKGDVGAFWRRKGENMNSSSVFSGFLLCGALALSACGEGMVSKATDERLDNLVANGLDGEERAAIEERFAAALDNNEETQDLTKRFAGQTAGGGSAGLNELLQAALETDPAIGRAAQAINRSDAERMNAIFAYLPQIDFTYEQEQINQRVVSTDNVVFQLGEAEYPVTRYGVELRQPIVDLSRVFGIRIAKTARSAAEVRYISAVQRTAYEVFDLYLQAAQSRARVDELKRRQGFLSEQERAMRSLEGLGVGDNSFRGAQLERAKLGSDIAQEGARYQRTLGELSFRTGRPVTDVPTNSIPRDVFGTERRISAEAAVELAKRNNPDILAAVIGVAEGDLRKRQAVAADFAPVLDAFYRFENEAREASRFGGGSQTEDAVFGVRLTVPLFNADGEGYRNLIARIDFRDAALQYFSTSRQITAEVSSSHNRMGELSKAIALSRQSVGVANRITADEQALVNSGISPQFLVAGRKVRASVAREQLSFYELEYLRAWALFAHLTGENLAER